MNVCKIKFSKEQIDDALLVTHKDCLDGTGSAILFKSFSKGKNVEYCKAGCLGHFFEKNFLYGSYADKLIIVVDLHFSENDKDTIDELQKRGNIFILDHHASAKHLTRYDWCHVDDSICGMQLLLKSMEDFVVPFNDFSMWNEFAELVADRDLWKNKIACSKHLSKIMDLYGQEAFVKRILRNTKERYINGRHYEYEKTSSFLLAEEYVLAVHLLEKEKECFRKCIEKYITKYFYGLKYGITISSTNNPSELLNRLLNADKQIDIAANINLDSRMVSLRSRGNIDVSQVAISHGGGGHVAAAGFSIDKKIINSIIEEVFDV
jgi:uncharacterized protein